MDQYATQLLSTRQNTLFLSFTIHDQTSRNLKYCSLFKHFPSESSFFHLLDKHLFLNIQIPLQTQASYDIRIVPVLLLSLIHDFLLLDFFCSVSVFKEHKHWSIRCLGHETCVLNQLIFTVHFMRAFKHTFNLLISTHN